MADEIPAGGDNVAFPTDSLSARELARDYVDKPYSGHLKLLQLFCYDPTRGVDVLVTSIKSPGEFYVRLLNQYSWYRDTCDDLDECEFNTPEVIEVGGVYGLQLKEVPADHVHSRVRVKILDSTTAIGLDSGMIFPYEEDQLFALSARQRQSWPLAMRCHLAGLAPVEEPIEVGGGDGVPVAKKDLNAWSPEAAAAFQQAVQEGTRHHVIFRSNGPSYAVQLTYRDGTVDAVVDAAEQLVNAKLACRYVLPWRHDSRYFAGTCGGVIFIDGKAIVGFRPAYVQKTFIELNIRLQQDLCKLTKPPTGQFCIAASWSGRLFRARIIGEDNGMVSVWDLDKWTLESVSRATTFEFPDSYYFEIPMSSIPLDINLDAKTVAVMKDLGLGILRDDSYIIAMQEEDSLREVLKGTIFKRIRTSEVMELKRFLALPRDDEGELLEPIPSMEEVEERNSEEELEESRYPMVGIEAYDLDREPLW